MVPKPIFQVASSELTTCESYYDGNFTNILKKFKRHLNRLCSNKSVLVCRKLRVNLSAIVLLNLQ